MKTRERLTFIAQLAIAAICLANGCGGKTLDVQTAGDIECKLIAGSKAVDLSCKARSLTKVKSVVVVLWIYVGSAGSEILKGEVEMGPDHPFRMPVLTPMSGRLQLDPKGECKNGIVVTFDVAGEARRMEFASFRTSCPGI